MPRPVTLALHAEELRAVAARLRRTADAVASWTEPPDPEREPLHRAATLACDAALIVEHEQRDARARG